MIPVPEILAQNEALILPLDIFVASRYTQPPQTMLGSTSLMLFALITKRCCNRITFRDQLNAEGRRRRDCRISRSALTSPTLSPFLYVLYSMSDQSMITMTGIDHVTFVAILQMLRKLC